MPALFDLLEKPSLRCARVGTRSWVISPVPGWEQAAWARFLMNVSWLRALSLTVIRSGAQPYLSALTAPSSRMAPSVSHLYRPPRAMAALSARPDFPPSAPPAAQKRVLLSSAYSPFLRAVWRTWVRWRHPREGPGLFTSIETARINLECFSANRQAIEQRYGGIHAAIPSGWSILIARTI